MENIWNIEKTRLLFSLVSQTAQRGESLSVAFSETAKRTGLSEGSVRNYYYSQAKLLKIMPELAEKMGVTPFERRSKPFTTFSPAESREIVRLALTSKARGVSVRTALKERANGDPTVALRLQNKYRSLLAHHRQLVLEIMDELGASGTAYFDPYLKRVIRSGDKPGLLAVMERVESLSHEEKEALLRKILQA